MKNKLLLLLPFFLYQCTPVVKSLYGIRNPRPESRESLTAFLAGAGQTDERLLVLADSAAWGSFFKKSVKLPQAHFFNSEGNYLEYRSKPDACPAEVSTFMQGLQKSSRHRPDSTHTLATALAPTFSLTQNRRFTPADLPPADYYLLLYWARFIGKMNRNAWEWEAEAMELRQRGVKLEVIYVNLDMQDWWKADEAETVR